jgi:hypothetical protein
LKFEFETEKDLHYSLETKSKFIVVASGIVLRDSEKEINFGWKEALNSNLVGSMIRSLYFLGCFIGIFV